MWHALESVVFIAVVALSTLLAGCPVPMPPHGYEPSSRDNLPGERPEWLIDGRTSREDVLLRLGTPDAEARDGSWIGYLSSRHLGGVLFIVPLGGPVGVETSSYTERRLVVWLDDRGIVSKAEFAEKECPRNEISAGATTENSEPCLSFADIEGGGNILSGTAAPEVGTLVGSFDDVVWSSPFFDPATGVAPPHFVAYRGPLFVTPTAVVASGNRIGRAGSGHVRIEFSDVADITRCTFWRSIALVVTTKAGVDYQFAAVHSGILGLHDREGTDRMIKLVEATLQRPARVR